ncbi:MAG: tail fiber domain-containing protein [Deltaproteobacteria bacterium]|nr:tail fiber domain-containing protein [Deltaproteobacteria bacterium]
MTLVESGNVGIGTATPNEQLEITGNLRLPPSTATGTAGVIKSGADPFIHNFGLGNFFAGLNAGNAVLKAENQAITGVGNTGVGASALSSDTDGSVNTASGLGALQANTTGSSNTASGLWALKNNTTGNFNTASGLGALSSNTGASNNTALGFLADVSSGYLTNATAIGANAVVNASNKIRLGDANVTLVETAGNLRVGAGGGFLGCVQDGNGTVILGTCNSDVRFKTRISPFAPLLDRLVQLQPVHFFWKATEFPDRQFGSSRSFGLIAQDAEKLLPELVTEDSSGYKAVRYNMLPLMTLQAMKEQQEQIKTLQEENADLRARLERLERMMGSYAVSMRVE